jgi:tetratricopeptide (TPR) repeat protein
MWGAAWLAYHQGDYDEADELSEELLPLARVTGERMDVRNAWTIQGIVTMARGRFTDALGPLRESLDICRELGPSWHLATSLLNLGMASMHAGDPAGAQGLIEEALGLYGQLGDRHFTARSLGYLAHAALLERDPERAGSLFATSLEMFRGLADWGGMAEGLEGLSAVSAAHHRPDRAARIAGAAEALRESFGARPLPFDRAVTEGYRAAVRASIDDDAWQTAWKEGADMPLDQAIAYALDQE